MSQKGTATFIAQRFSAVLLLPFIVWFLSGVVAYADAPREELMAWLATPLNAALMGALLFIGAFHMRIGLNEIIDDYAHGGMKGVWKIVNLFVCLGAAALGGSALYSILV
jgi:succinate dehydrogenase / fumarate reductase membrane anchor subunit